LNNPFKISFTKEIPDLDKDKIIELFLINLKGTLYEKVETESNNRIIIKGEFYSFDPTKNVPWNLWTGFSGKAELYFPKENVIVYSVDFSYGIISLICGLFFFLIFPLLFSFAIDRIYLGFLAVGISVFILSIIIKLLLHRHLFNKTIRLENRFTGTYDWKKILKNKSDNELENIANGNTILTLEVQKLAIEEIINRKNV